MKKNILWRLILIGFSVVMALVFLLPATPIFDKMPQWWKNVMPSQAIVLGLDLRGGLHLVFEVEWDKAVDVTTVRTARRLREAFEKKNRRGG